MPSLQGPLWPGVVVPERVLSMGQIELFLYASELFEIELFIGIKIDLALITYNGGCAKKPNQTPTIG